MKWESKFAGTAYSGAALTEEDSKLNTAEEARQQEEQEMATCSVEADYRAEFHFEARLFSLVAMAKGKSELFIRI